MCSSSRIGTNIYRRTFARNYECSLHWKIDDLELVRGSGVSVRSGEFPTESTFDSCKWEVELYYVQDSREFGLILAPRTSTRWNDEDLHQETPFLNASCRFAFYDPLDNEVQVTEGRLCRDMFSFRVTEDSIFGRCATRDFLKLNVTVRASKWCEHTLPEELGVGEDYFAKRLVRMLESEKFTDVTIEAPGTKVKGHKCVLASHSPVFEAMFGDDFTEKTDSKVFLPDLDTDIAKLLFRYMYTMESPVFVDQNQATRLYAFSDKYGMAGLLSICRRFLLMNASRDNVSDLMRIADVFSDGVLKNSLIGSFPDINDTEEMTS